MFYVSNNYTKPTLCELTTTLHILWAIHINHRYHVYPKFYIQNYLQTGMSLRHILYTRPAQVAVPSSSTPIHHALYAASHRDLPSTLHETPTIATYACHVSAPPFIFHPSQPGHRRAFSFLRRQRGLSHTHTYTYACSTTFLPHKPSLFFSA